MRVPTTSEPGAPSYPDPVCQGCGGNGVGAHVAPRAIQLIEQLGPPWLTKQGKTRELTRIVRIAVLRYDQEREQGVFIGPLIACCDVFDRLVTEGWTFTDGMAPDRAWACQWCSGTGERRLSVESMTADLVRRKEPCARDA